MLLLAAETICATMSGGVSVCVSVCVCVCVSVSVLVSLVLSLRASRTTCEDKSLGSSTMSAPLNEMETRALSAS